ncbi:M15 family metallopeptidase [Actinomadura bangladeshensis]|uniref:M15 family metallopeptidase n=1 Tax=Actinomadura bangladeshensis TaxID=453573 RepID=UPI0019435742|nr:M15 family metallopeptidase [Actinomadura bangladeshensis]
MTRTPPSARTTTRRIRLLLVVGLTSVIAAIIAALDHQPRNSSSPSPPVESASPAPPSSFLAVSPSKAPRRARIGKADGVVPGGVTVFNDRFPAVANLDPELLRALRQAATDAADDGVAFYVNSGWRSAEYQDRLLRDAVSKYGSEEEAARWVATAATSSHVSGDAVDIGHPDAASWLSGHGAVYGLCQIYKNEPWHYELRPKAIGRGCPQMYADPTQDPRMHQ